MYMCMQDLHVCVYQLQDVPMHMGTQQHSQGCLQQKPRPQSGCWDEGLQGVGWDPAEAVPA